MEMNIYRPQNKVYLHKALKQGNRANWMKFSKPLCLDFRFSSGTKFFLKLGARASLKIRVFSTRTDSNSTSRNCILLLESFFLKNLLLSFDLQLFPITFYALFLTSSCLKSLSILSYRPLFFISSVIFSYFFVDEYYRQLY